MRTPSVLFSPHAIAGLCLTLALGACGGGDVTLPPDGEPASIEVLDGDGQTGKVGLPLTNPLVVGVFDARGRPVAGATVIFEFSQAGPDAAVVPAEKTTNGDGVADAQLVLGTTVGRQTGQVRVAVPDGRAPILAQFSAVALSENANNMAAVAGQDQTGHVGHPLDDRLVVEVTDGFGNPVAGVEITWTAAGGGSVSETVVPTGEDGRSRVERTLGTIVGQQTTIAEAQNLAGSPVVFTHTAVAGDASRLTVVSGNGQTAEAGSLLPDALVVRLVDSEGNGVPNTGVTWVIASGGGSVTPQNTTTDGDGHTSAQWTLGPALGEQRADAVVSGVGVATFRTTATSSAPPSLFIRTQPSSSARNGVPLGRQPVVQLRDGAGNDLSAAGVEVTVSLGGGGELGGTLRQTTDANGRVTFDNLSISGAPGTRTLVFQALGYAQVTSDPIDLQAIGTTTTITGDTPDPSAVGGTVTVSFRVSSEGPTPSGSVTVSDGVQSCSGTLSNGAGSCTLDLTTAGSRTLTATYSGGPGLSGSSGTEGHTVTQPAPANVAPTADFDARCDELECDFDDESEDPDGRIESRQWEFGDGSTSDDRNPDHQYAAGGIYTVRLTVTDDDGATASVTHDVTVSQEAASTNTRFEVDDPDPTIPGQSFTVTLSVRSDDGSPEGTATVTDGVDSCSVPIVGGEGSCFLALTTVGERTLTATFEGNMSFASSSARETHTVNPPPAASTTTAITSDAPDPSNPDEVVTVSFTVTASGGSPTGTVTVSDANGGGCTGTAPSGSCSYTPVGTGTRTITATYAGNSSFGGSSGTAEHTVNPPPNNAPTAAFDPPSCTAGQPCQFTDGSSDSDGSVASRAWTFEDGAPSSSPETDPVVTFATEGDKTVTLTVTDDDGATSSIEHEVSVAVAPAPAPRFLGIRAEPRSQIESGGRLEPEIELLDAGRNEVALEGVEVTVTLKDATGVAELEGETVRVTDRNGRARFRDLRVNGVEDASFVLAFSAPGFASVDSQTISIQED